MELIATLPLGRRIHHASPWFPSGARIGENAPASPGARAVEVTYRVGNHRYKETYDQKLYLCAPESEYISSSIARDGKKPCPGPEPPKSSRTLG
jgi:hypothetical protein